MRMAGYRGTMVSSILMGLRGTLLFLTLVARRYYVVAEALKVELSSLPTYYHPSHTHQSILDPDGVFTVFWTPDLVRQVVVWEIHARTTGWLGFGFSTNGAMDGADMVTVWVVDGRLHLQDRHGVGFGTPPVDDRNDWRPLHALENDTHTVVVMERDINTCDPHDYKLTNETVRLLYAWGSEDPIGDHPTYHGKHRGNRYALVLASFHHDMLPESDTEVWQVRQRVTLPHTQDTFYWCHIEKIPDWPQKHHYIGFGMEYGQNAYTNLHHSVAFECHTQDGTDPGTLLEQYVGQPGYECYTPNMPPPFYLCERFIINWAIGSEGEFLPQNVGYPLGYEHGGASYIMFQTHYDNRQLDKDVTVEWGMNIYHTSLIRQEEGGNMALGHALLFSLTVPPSTTEWLVAGHCAAECTAASLPPEGVNIFMVFLHGHYLVKAIRLRHFRGDKELQPIAVDKNYAADYQQSRRLTKEVKLLPGDHLTVECDYDSHQRASATFSGWRSDDEMCQAFINFYPRVPLALCRSSTHPRQLQQVYQLPPFKSNLDLLTFEFDPEVGGGGERYQDRVNALPWGTLNKRQMNKAIVEGEQVIKCLYNYGVPLKIGTNVTGYPKATPYTPPEDQTCAAGSLGSTTSFVAVVTYLVFLMSFVLHL